MPPIAVEPGSRLVDRYRLDAPLGEAGDTAYWRAQDELLDRPVGVCLLTGGADGSRSVLRAARRAAAVTDPRFLRVLDASETDDVVYVVTEWVKGRSLADMLEDGPLPPGEARTLAAEIAEALAAAHEQGLSHLCLKPEHVLLTGHGQVKVSGLGVDAAARGLAADGREDAARRDTQGCAAVLYAALTARWPGDEPTRLGAAPHDAGELCSPRQVRAGIPDDLDDLICRALGTRSRAGATPLETPAEMARELASAQATSRIPAVAPAPDTEPDTPYPAGYLPAFDDTRRHQGWATRTAWAFATLVLVGGLALAGWQLVVTVTDEPAEGGAQTPAGQESSDAPGGNEPLRVRDITTLDPPPGGNGEENDDRLERIVDGEPSSVWTTKSYNDQLGPAGLKEGLGIVLDLGRERPVSQVAVDLEGSGTDLEMRVSSEQGEGVDDYEEVASESGAQGRARLEPDQPVKARYVLLWFTALPSDESGFRAGVAEVVVRG